MNTISIVCIIAAVFSVLSAAIIVIKNVLHTNKTFKRLSIMLDQAMSQSFSESIFDESKLSALETRFGHFISDCSVSAKKIDHEKDKIKSLISDISHQTKTPIANILLYSQLLCEQELSCEAKTCVSQISNQTEKLKFLIGSLVKISRLETGVIFVVPEVNSVQELINLTARQIRAKASEKNIEIVNEDSSCKALFDMKWTEEAIYNIVDNAVKYTPYGKRIIIKTTPFELFCRIDIIDEGIGIAEVEQSKIFGRFYRSPAVSRQEGAGIGLFLAREIISVQGGYIKVSSKVGKGSTFSVFLPQ